MKAGRQYKESQKAEPIQSKRERSHLSFEDNRSQIASQTKLIHFLQKKENKIKLSDDLKTDVGNLSSFSMDDVRVHCDSDKPAQLNALAYEQGTDIQQEKHLPHDAWHMVQQKQGHVQPTTQLHSVNDNEGLEKRTNALGDKIVQRTIWDDIDILNKPSTPDQYANNLRRYPEFEELYGKAVTAVQTTYDKSLIYSEKPSSGGGNTNAYFKDGTIFFNLNDFPPAILANTIFETANAAQSSQFLQLEKDFENDSITEKTLEDYGINDIGESLSQEFMAGDKITRRSIIQERYEWGSFLLAKPTFLKVKDLTLGLSGKSQEGYDAAFNAFNTMLEMESFEDYYTEYGKDHRKSVEGVLRSIKEKQSSPCYITTACVTMKGLLDDCEELTVLRDFRDTYLINKPNGKDLIAMYYTRAPYILGNIHKRRKEEEDMILENIYGIVRECVDAILSGDNEFAFRTYCDMVVKLDEEYGN